MAWEREIEVCRGVALRAGDLALRHAARGVHQEDKSDDSPVTIADRECEELIVSELRAAFPGDGFLGEEGADHGGTSGRRWIVDPIDGTRDFVRGLSTWSNLIGLEADGEVVLGTCNLAAQGELYWAVRGEGAFVNGKRLSVSSIDRRDRAIACLTAFDNIAAYLGRVRGIPPAKRWPPAVANGSITVLDVTAAGTREVLVNHRPGEP